MLLNTAASRSASMGCDMYSSQSRDFVVCVEWSGMVAMLDGQDGHSGTHLGRLAGGLGGRAAKGENGVQAEGRARPQRENWAVAFLALPSSSEGTARGK